VARTVIKFVRDISDGIAAFGEYLDRHPWFGPTILLSVLLAVVVTR
jgi:hypothetical protein